MSSQSPGSSHSKRKKKVSNQKVHSPFWNPSLSEASSKMSGGCSLDGPKRVFVEDISLNAMECDRQHKTWFEVRRMIHTGSSKKVTVSSDFVTDGWPRTKEMNERVPSVEISNKGTMVKEKIRNKLDSLVGVRKVRLHLRNEDDKSVLDRIFGAVRFTYNKCVEYVNIKKKDEEMPSDQDSESVKKTTLKQILRTTFVNINSDFVKENQWLKDVGYDIRNCAVDEFITAMKGNVTKLKNGDIDHFKMSFRSKKKMKTESFYLRKGWIKQLKNATKEDEDGYVTGFVLKLPNVKPVVAWAGKRCCQDEILMDCKFQRTKSGRLYLCVPQVLSVKRVDIQDPSNIKKSLKVCSLDPGVRTFQTIFDPNEGCAYQVAPNDINRIIRLCLSLDRIISKQSKERSRMKFRLKRVERRMRFKIRNLIDEVHKQLAKHLSTHYDLILIPKFETSQMVKKGSRNIGSKSVRQMLCWSHFRFRERLLFKCREYGSNVAVVDESWTSKTCSGCGLLDHNLGSKKVYWCRGCGLTIDRDVNGAKNILLKNFKALDLVFETDQQWGLPLPLLKDGVTQSSLCDFAELSSSE
jgi:putative transposase